MIANISAAVSCFEETLNTLKYANRAKNIKTTVSRNVVSVNHHISEYVSLISNLRGEISRLKGQLGSQNGPLLEAPLHHHNGGHEDDDNGDTPTRSHESIHEEMRASSGSLDKQKLAEMKNWIQENFRERMQLRRSLIELEDQNVQNSIEIGKRQVGIVKWTESRGRTPKRNDLVEQDATTTSSVVVEELLRAAPEPVKIAWSECEQLRLSIEKNVGIKRSIAKRLRDNERQAEEFQSSGLGSVTGEDRQELLGLQYKIGKLELENMELEQSQFIHKSIMKGKDLTIQKLQLQLAMKDKLIAQQRAVLVEHGLGDQVSGYSGILLMDHKQLAQVCVCVVIPVSK
jgi:kinesin family member 18/19